MGGNILSTHRKEWQRFTAENDKLAASKDRGDLIMSHTDAEFGPASMTLDELHGALRQYGMSMLGRWKGDIPQELNKHITDILIQRLDSLITQLDAAPAKISRPNDIKVFHPQFVGDDGCTYTYELLVSLEARNITYPHRLQTRFIASLQLYRRGIPFVYSRRGSQYNPPSKQLQFSPATTKTATTTLASLPAASNGHPVNASTSDGYPNGNNNKSAASSSKQANGTRVSVEYR